MKISYTCQNEECEHDFAVAFTPSTPDRHMSGRMEDAEQGYAAEADPCECPKCNHEVDAEALEEELVNE